MNRDELPQGSLVEHECEADAQALINISRKRLCNQASPETREAWKLHDPVLASVCVPECIYRGTCVEMHSCGYVNTDAYKAALAAYRDRKCVL